MGCWVVPTVAADLWGVSVDQVWEAIHAGRLHSRLDAGFTLVRANPDGMQASCISVDEPSTYVQLSSHVEIEPPHPTAPTDTPQLDDAPQPPAEILTDDELAALRGDDWNRNTMHEVRRAVGQRRRRPAA